MKPQVGLALNSEMLHRTVGIVVHTYGQKILYAEEMESWKSGGWTAVVKIHHLYLNLKKLFCRWVFSGLLCTQ